MNSRLVKALEYVKRRFAEKPRSLSFGMFIVTSIALVMLILIRLHWTFPIEVVGLDALLGSASGQSDIVLVEITDEDYSNPMLFHSTSPLRRDLVKQLIHVVAQANPAHIVVDIDLSDDVPETTGTKKAQRSFSKKMDSKIIGKDSLPTGSHVDDCTTPVLTKESLPVPDLMHEKASITYEDPTLEGETEDAVPMLASLPSFAYANEPQTIAFGGACRPFPANGMERFELT